MGIEKALDGSERNDETLRDVVERQLDLKTAVVDGEVPELVLENDRHALGVILAQPLGDGHAGVTGIEGNIEVMIAGKAGLFTRAGRGRTTPRSASWVRIS